MTVVTRFAPSPTGYLHIGGARTALFNWLYARHTGGVFLLRIEDTDRQRSTKAAIDAILDGLRWLGLDWDAPETYQAARADRHAAVAHDMLARGRAYHCWCTPEELEAQRAEQRAAGRPVRYDGRCRHRDPATVPAGLKPVVRLLAPSEGETVVEDQVQGTVRFANDQLDDLVLLRGDGTPTYMLAVVVDDHDMGITHVIRGDDHLTNTARQILISQANDWALPVFSHIPLIHGPDGAKLSKRHGALGVDAYRDMGLLPEAVRNYLLRLGWGHGDDEIISDAQAIEWFDLSAIGRSPSRFDMAKLTNLNYHYLRSAADDRLVELVVPFIEKALGRGLTENARARLLAGMPGLKDRAKSLLELAESAAFYAAEPPFDFTAKAAKILDDGGRTVLSALRPALIALPDWNDAALEEAARAHAEANGLKLGAVAQPLRAAMTGTTVSPPIFEVLRVLGPSECLRRLDAAL
ncbi:glutamate--tRNA ligase 2 [Tistrella bauzanensis]|uniref:Glutamate--tRNA ligase n=1 Tax=Tistrella bauzanensis TaxID=657419 RepID=A0ABQ1IB57_9PROT|nr:glutamate--tRNA ligase [Tistrella bauzanensis]GGB30398.1 glutamate--tRNA ligase 2 [Tistrella bauzanensis]